MICFPSDGDKRLSPQEEQEALQKAELYFLEKATGHPALIRCTGLCEIALKGRKLGIITKFDAIYRLLEAYKPLVGLRLEIFKSC